MSQRRNGTGRTGAPRSRLALVHVAIAIVAVIAMAGTAAAFWAASGPGSGVVSAATLTKPTTATATSVDFHTVNVSWTASPTSVPNMAYKVVRVGATSAVICQTAATSCTDTTAQASTTYSYTVEAVIGAWTSGTTSSPPVTTPAEPVRSLSFTSSGTPTCASGSVTLASGVTSWTSSVTRTNSTGPLAIALAASAGTVTPTSVSVATGNNESGSFTISGLPTGTTIVTATAPDHTSAACNVTVAASVAPSVTGVSSTLADGSYKAGQVVPVTVTFSQAVTVTGTPRITLSTGSPSTTPVSYTSGSGTNTLSFSYIVAAGNQSSDLDYASSSALQLNGGTIKNGSTDAVLTLPTPGAPGSLGANKALVIDTTAPTGVTVSCAFVSGSNYTCSGSRGIAAGDVPVNLKVTIVRVSNGAAEPGHVDLVPTYQSPAGWTLSSTGLANNNDFQAKVTQTDLAGNATTVTSNTFSR